MDRYAVIGQPISHSLSPRIHAAFAQQTAQTLNYEALLVAPEELEARLRALHADGWLGLNVTLPHKQAVAKLCESVSARAELAGAVNTLVRTESGWRGDNTDGEGCIQDLRRLGIEVRGARVLILGAGGAARGILGPLLEQQPAQLVVSNRNPWKPEQLAESFKAQGRIEPRTHVALKGDRYDLVINATSAGHGGSMPFLPGPLLASNGICYDLSYGCAHAPFAAWALTQQPRLISDGLGMLIEQAASAFAIWRGQRPQTAAVLTLLRAGIESAAADAVSGHVPVRRQHAEKPPQD
jgi:shikimate dehydrogenase